MQALRRFLGRNVDRVKIQNWFSVSELSVLVFCLCCGFNSYGTSDAELSVRIRTYVRAAIAETERTAAPKGKVDSNCIGPMLLNVQSEVDKIQNLLAVHLHGTGRHKRRTEWLSEVRSKLVDKCCKKSGVRPSGSHREKSGKS